MKPEELDVVRLRDGRECVLLTDWGEGKAFEAEFDFSENSDVRTIEAAEIAEIVEKHKAD